MCESELPHTCADHMLQLFFPLSWVPFPPELLFPLRCSTPILPHVPAIPREEGALYGAQGEECPSLYMSHSALFLGTGFVGLVQEEILVDLELCCQPRGLSQMLNKGRQAGWGLRSPSVHSFEDLRKKLGWWETPVGWVQGEFASYWDAEFEATMLLTWERGVSHLILVPRDMGHLYKHSGAREPPESGKL